MIIAEAYEVLRTAGCVSSQRAFSKEWLGRGPSYLSSTLARRTTRAPGLGVLLHLYVQVRQHLEDAVTKEPTHRDRLALLAERLWATAMDRVSRYRSSS